MTLVAKFMGNFVYGVVLLGAGVLFLVASLTGLLAVSGGVLFRPSVLTYVVALAVFFLSLTLIVGSVRGARRVSSEQRVGLPLALAILSAVVSVVGVVVLGPGAL